MTRIMLALMFTLAACGSDKDDPDDGIIEDDTDENTDADSDDTGSTSGDPCTATVSDSDPVGGSTGWYYRDPIEVFFDQQPEDSVQISLATADGTDVAVSLSWNDEHGESVEVTGDMVGNTDYVLTVACAEDELIAFSTSEFGTPLTTEDADLIGRVYELDLPDATFTHPPGIGAVLSAYLTSPLLVQVEDVDASSIEVKAAQGYWDDDGVVEQIPDSPTYPFPAADFTAAPFFSADTDYLAIAYDSETDIQIHNMHLEGTFNADATKIGGASIGGLADTRNLGPLLGMGSSETAVCEYLEVLGLPCVDCGNGDEFCLYLEAHFNDAPYVEGLSLAD